MYGLHPWHLLVIIGAALLIFGPDRLPTLAKDAGKVLRQLRRMANDVRDDLKDELGPEIGALDLKSMHPKALIHKHLLDPALDEIDEARGVDPAQPATSAGPTAPAVPAPPAVSAGTTLSPAGTIYAPTASAATPYDLDAT